VSRELLPGCERTGDGASRVFFPFFAMVVVGTVLCSFQRRGCISEKLHGGACVSGRQYNFNQ
jgi:hypothetical protein